MNFPLDHETATADLLSDIFPLTLRAVREPDLCALVRMLDQDLIATGRLDLAETAEGREVLSRRSSTNRR